jgi:hypothetical protein
MKSTAQACHLAASAVAVREEEQAVSTVTAGARSPNV